VVCVLVCDVDVLGKVNVDVVILLMIQSTNRLVDMHPKKMNVIRRKSNSLLINPNVFCFGLVWFGLFCFMENKKGTTE